MLCSKLQFRTKTTRITIDYDRCMATTGNTTDPACHFACVKACRLYGRNVLRIENNRPALAVADEAEIARLDNECLSCEYRCLRHGTGCISIELPTEGLEEYRQKNLRQG